MACVALADPTLPTLPPQIGLSFIDNCNMPNVKPILIENANRTLSTKPGDYTKNNDLMDTIVS